MTELERCREALEAFGHTFDSIKEHSKHGEMTINSEILQQAIRQMKHDACEFATIVKNALYPPPEMETVGITVWAIVSPSGFVETTSASEDLQRSQVGNENSPFFKHQVASLTGTITRPKKQPVEKSARVAFNADGWGRADGGDWQEVSGKSGTFTWHE